jgi:hypothetical protein
MSPKIQSTEERRMVDAAPVGVLLGAVVVGEVVLFCGPTTPPCTVGGLELLLVFAAAALN